MSTDPSEPDVAPQSQRRRALLERFEAWLDEALADEPPPAGIAAEILAALDADARGDAALQSDPSGSATATFGGDLESLWAALTALTGEVKLQGRSFERLRDAFTSQAAPDEQSDTAARGRDGRGSADGPEQTQMLDALIDTRDRLRRGLDGAQAQLDAVRTAGHASWLRRLFGQQQQPLLEVTEAIEQGYAMTLDRIDETLRSLGVAEIECAGLPFDPHRMQAAQVQICDGEDDQDGRVVEVLRPGYERHGELLRPSQVKVARCKS